MNKMSGLAIHSTGDSQLMLSMWQDRVTPSDHDKILLWGCTAFVLERTSIPLSIERSTCCLHALPLYVHQVFWKVAELLGEDFVAIIM
jgi:hypothetical protein